MDNEKSYDEIENFLAGRMSTQEAVQFRRRVADNPDLASDVRLHQEISASTQSIEAISDLRSKVDQITKEGRLEKEEDTTVRRLTVVRVLGVAASITILLAISVLLNDYFNSAGDVTPSSLYAANISYPETIYESSVFRSSGDNDPVQSISPIDSIWKVADAYYQSEDYQNALKSVQNLKTLEIQKTEQPSSRSFYYEGVVLTRMNKYHQAITSFEQVRVDYTEDAAWKKALILLQLPGKLDAAKTALYDIIEENTPHRDAARKLIEQLEEID